MDSTTDRYGATITPGDTVYLVHGGEEHHMTVSSILPAGDDGLPALTGAITVTVPARSVRLVKKAPATPKPESTSRPAAQSPAKPETKTEPKKGTK